MTNQEPHVLLSRFSSTMTQNAAKSLLYSLLFIIVVMIVCLLSFSLTVIMARINPCGPGISALHWLLLIVNNLLIVVASPEEA